MTAMSALLESCKKTKEFEHQNHFKFLGKDGCRDLLIIFSSFQANSDSSRYRFYRYASSSDANVLFIADRSSLWYSRGVPGLGSNVDEVANSLCRVRDALNAERVMTVGGSMGGYASLLFGALINADVIVATGPDVRVNSFHSKSRRLRRLFFEEHGVDTQYEDLRKLDYSNTGNINILVGEFDIFDRLQLTGRPDKWNIYTLAGSAHSVPEYLSAYGILDNVLDHFLFNRSLETGILIQGSWFPDDFYDRLRNILDDPKDKMQRLLDLNKEYPDNYWPSYLLGSLLLRRNPQKAAYMMRQAVKIEPKFWRVHLELSKLLRESNPASSMHHLRIYIDNDVCSKPLYWKEYLEMLVNSGKYEQARKKAEAFKRRFPKAYRSFILRSGLHVHIRNQR